MHVQLLLDDRLFNYKIISYQDFVTLKPFHKINYMCDKKKLFAQNLKIRLPYDQREKR